MTHGRRWRSNAASRMHSEPRQRRVRAGTNVRADPARRPDPVGWLAEGPCRQNPGGEQGRQGSLADVAAWLDHRDVRGQGLRPRPAAKPTRTRGAGWHPSPANVAGQDPDGGRAEFAVAYGFWPCSEGNELVADSGWATSGTPRERPRGRQVRIPRQRRDQRPRLPTSSVTPGRPRSWGRRHSIPVVTMGVEGRRGDSRTLRVRQLPGIPGAAWSQRSTDRGARGDVARTDQGRTGPAR